MVDKQVISEANVVKLHSYFSAMYPDTERLSVHLKTSLNAPLRDHTTEEDIKRVRCALAGLPYKKRKPKPWEKEAEAVLSRTGGGRELFRYRLERADPEEMTSVLVKGEDTLCRGCKRLAAESLETGDVKDYRENDVPCHFAIWDSVMEGRRFVRLFINAEDSSVPRLIALLRHFSDQNPERTPLVIKVYTNIEQEYDFLVPTGDKRFSAALFDDSGNVVIRYRRPNEYTTTLVLEGNDIFPDLGDYEGTEGSHRAPPN